MRVLVAPDAFAGTLSAVEAAEAIAEGWAATAPRDVTEQLPLADGGPGFLDVLTTVLRASLVAVPVTGPLGDPVAASLLVCRDREGTAYLESAHGAGLHLVPTECRDAARATSYGVGELIKAAIDSGSRRVVVGVGGTASTDGGAGLLAALGAQPHEQLRAGGAALIDVAEVDLEPARALLGDVELVAATDVGSPLLGPDGAAHGFAGQKGADRATRDQLEAALRTWATHTDGGLAVHAGAGAGGGIGFGLLLLGARRVSGAELVADAVRLADRAGGVDLVVTGEGAFDWQSLRGKVVAAVAHAGQKQGRPVVVLAGRVEVGRRQLASIGIDSAYAIDELPPSERSGTPYDGLRALAARVARTWSHSPGDV